MVTQVLSLDPPRRTFCEIAVLRYALQLESHFAAGGLPSEVTALISDLAEVFSVGAEGKVKS